MDGNEIHSVNERENVIYGAGVFGRRLWEFFRELPVPIHFFCQTEKESKPIDIDGIPVIALEELKTHDAEKNIFLSICDKKTSNNLKKKLQALFLDTARVYECGDFIDCCLEHSQGEHYCLICGSRFDNFVPGGGIYEIFEQYHITGGGIRRNCACPCCGAIDRERWTHKVLLDKTDIYTDPCRILHFAPEDKIREMIRQNKQCDYYDADIEPVRAEHMIDMTSIPFRDNAFEYIIANHVLEHIREEEKALSELSRVLKKDGKLILSFPICKDKKTEEETVELSEQERIAKFGQEDHVRLYGTDYKERLEKRGFRCRCYSPEDSLSAEQIERYGLIADDVCIICEKCME